MSTWPAAVNLKALESRFLRICCKPLRVAREGARQIRIEIDVERQVLVSAMWRKLRSTESRSDAKLISSASTVTVPGLDLRQIENVVDEIEQVRAGGVNVLRELDLLRIQIADRRFRRAAGRGSGSNSAACATRATCWRGIRICISRSARVPPPFLPARGGPARSRCSCVPLRRFVRPVRAPFAPAPRWSAAVPSGPIAVRR